MREEKYTVNWRSGTLVADPFLYLSCPSSFFFLSYRGLRLVRDRLLPRDKADPEITQRAQIEVANFANSKENKGPNGLVLNSATVPSGVLLGGFPGTHGARRKD